MTRYSSEDGLSEPLRRLRVLYSFPHRIGAQRICTTAWHQAVGAANAGALLTVIAGSVSRAMPDGMRVRSTLALGNFRIPYRILGRGRACAFHDWQVARWLGSHRNEIDVVHVWPLAALHTMRVARRYGIPVVLERINAHTRFAYREVADECSRVGVALPAGHDHEFNSDHLEHEEAEYGECDFLLCPSDFVSRTFVENGIPQSKIIRHQYGYDERSFLPEARSTEGRGLVMLYAGVCEPRKGLHYALESWLASGAAESGTFLICGNFIPGYGERLASMLSHPSVKVLGHRTDLPELMRKADLFVLSSIEEGSALVTYEARGSGCVLLVSDAAGAMCRHMDNALVHPGRDVKALTAHIKLVNSDRELLARLREKSLETASEITWSAAGWKLYHSYREAMRRFGNSVGKH